MMFASSTITVAANRATATWPWYTARAAGFVAAGLLILLMLSGIGHVTGLTYRILPPVKAWAVHKAMALALCASIAIHVLALLLDHVVAISVPQVLVPFTLNYSNGVPLFGIRLGPIAVALGVLAMYGVVIMVLSSLGWIEKRRGVWRKLHYISYAVMLFVFVHALGVGSDLKYGVFRWTWIALVILIGLAIVSRVARAGTLRHSKRKSEKGSDSAQSSD